MQRWHVVVLFVCLAIAISPLEAQPSPPTADPTYPNVWYGAVPPGGGHAPVLVFIHGLGGTASFFWVGNDMYSMAYAGGYRTAFISMNADNTPNSATIAQNGVMIKTTLPVVAAHYGSRRLSMVGHSKGGLDTQYALGLYPAVRGLVRAVFTLATPNQGAQMADWAFGPGKPLANKLGLLSPGMASLEVANVQTYRSTWDPIFAAAGIPFYFLAGNSYGGNALTAVTGPILQGLSGQANDGLVAPTEAVLPWAWSTNLGTVPYNHFQMGTGSVSFPFIQANLAALAVE